MCRSASDGGRRCPGGNAPTPDGYIAPTPEQLAAYQESLAAERREQAERAAKTHTLHTTGDNSPAIGVHYGPIVGQDNR